MARNVLVTGAAGYIGSLTVAALAKHAGVATIVAYDVRPAEVPQPVIVVCGDITEDDLAPILEQYAIDSVIHLASILKPPIGAPDDLAWRVDVQGTQRLLQACIAQDVQHLTVTTSGAAYGYHPDNPMWLSEDAPTRGHPAFAYSNNKRQVEELLAKCREQHPQLQQLVLRPGTVIGKGTHSPVTEIFEGKVIVGVRGSAAPFVFIWDQDLVAILVQGVLERREGIYNLAGDGALTAHEIARRMHKPYLPLPANVLAAGLGLFKRLGKSAHGPETVDFLRYRPVLANQRLQHDFNYRPISSAAAFQLWLDNSDTPRNPREPGDADYRQVVAITGGAGAIGKALARRWAIGGAHIALLDVEAEPLAKAAAELKALGADVFTVTLDVTDADGCATAMASVAEHFGHIDILVNNAGAVHRSALVDTDIDVYRKVMEVNYFGSLNCTKAALPHLLRSRGMIVVISSIAGVAPLYGRTGYAASKHALHGLFESARTELEAQGVRVLIACPNFTRSPFEQRALGAHGQAAGTKRSMTGTIAEPDDVARAIVDGAKRGKNLLVLTRLGKLAYYLSRLAPDVYARKMVKRIKTGSQVR
jgi:UDP-glucose 4-epimerase